MSHNLAFDQKANEYRMFSATGKRGAPWHHLGQMVIEAQSWEQAAKLAHIDFNVTKHQLKSPITNESIQAWGMFRDDNNAFLGTVGSVYEPIQVSQAFSFVDTLLEAEKGAHYESAGALGAGNRFWVLARVPYSIKIGKTGDVTECFLLFESSHDGTLSATAKLTTVRVVCQNTLSMALGMNDMATLKVRHSGNGIAKLDAAKKMLTGVQQTVGILSDKLNELARRKVDAKVNMEIITKLFGADWQDSKRKVEQVQKIAELFESNDGNAVPEIRGSAYNLLNAITEYTDHFRDVRVTKDREGQAVQQVRSEGALFGGAGEQMKSRALETILEMTDGCAMMDESTISVPDKVEKILSMVA